MARPPNVVLAACLVLAGTAFAQVPGWRRDGSGIFPDTTPPLRWSLSKNVLWSTKLPAWSNGSPIVAGGRIFVTAEPTTLLALDENDGRVLWQREVTVADTLPPEEAARVRALVQEARDAGARIAQKQGELSRLRREARKRSVGPEARARLDALTRELQAHREKVQQAAPYLPPLDIPVMGNSTSTPVADGQNVFALFGNRVVASFDFGGKLRWARQVPALEGMMHGHYKGLAASLLLADGKLIVPAGPLSALAPGDGRVVWSSVPYRDFGTPVLGKVLGVDALFTPHGEIVRLHDGEQLEHAPEMVWFIAPLAAEGTVYYLGNGPSQGKGSFGAAYQVGGSPKLLWKIALRDETYYASPLLHDGRIFLLDKSGWLAVIDAATGQIVEARDLSLGEGTAYPSLALAGGRVFASTENGTTAVLDAAPPFREVARNTLAPFRSTPVFVKGRMYVRTLDRLYCVGK